MLTSFRQRAADFFYNHILYVLAFYFVAHVVVRIASSPTLGFDESEQVHLSQSLELGYNAQPPLYTWIQTALFGLFGYAVLPLAMLKNAFLFGTYFVAFRITQQVTGDRRLALIATLGLLLIPQIAWESHRDLSHTVAATFATLLLLWSVISLRSQLCHTAGAHDETHVFQRPPQTWRCFFGYLGIGICVGTGIMFKYNFLIVTFAFVAAALSLRSFRGMLLDRRIIASVFIAFLIIGPHATWVFSHPELAFSKTIATLTTDQAHHWLLDVSTGMSALLGSILSCSLLLTVVYATFLFGRSLSSPTMTHRAGDLPGEDDGRFTHLTAIFLERFLLVVLVVLAGLVLTGHALEFKNRWLQPFVCVLPIYFTTRFRSRIVGYQGTLNRAATAHVTSASVVVMAVVLTMTLTRPIIRAQSGNYGLLNVPYALAAEQIGESIDGEPDLILVQNTRIAGNLRVKFRNARIVSQDSSINASDLRSQLRHRPAKVLVVNQADEPATSDCKAQADFVSDLLDEPTLLLHWKQISVPYLFSTDDAKTFRYAVADYSKNVAYRKNVHVHR